MKASLIENFENYEILTNSKFAANINEKVNLIFILKQEDFVILQIISAIRSEYYFPLNLIHTICGINATFNVICLNTYYYIVVESAT